MWHTLTLKGTVTSSVEDTDKGLHRNTYPHPWPSHRLLIKLHKALMKFVKQTHGLLSSNRCQRRVFWECHYTQRVAYKNLKRTIKDLTEIPTSVFEGCKVCLWMNINVWRRSIGLRSLGTDFRHRPALHIAWNGHYIIHFVSPHQLRDLRDELGVVCRAPRDISI